MHTISNTILIWQFRYRSVRTHTEHLIQRTVSERNEAVVRAESSCSLLREYREHAECRERHPTVSSVLRRISDKKWVHKLHHVECFAQLVRRRNSQSRYSPLRGRAYTPPCRVFLITREDSLLSHTPSRRVFSHVPDDRGARLTDPHTPPCRVFLSFHLRLLFHSTHSTQWFYYSGDHM